MNVISTVLDSFPDFDLNTLDLNSVNTIWESSELIDLMVNKQDKDAHLNAMRLFKELTDIREKAYGKCPEYVESRIESYVRLDLNQLSTAGLELLRESSELRALMLYADGSGVNKLFSFHERIGELLNATVTVKHQ